MQASQYGPPTTNNSKYPWGKHFNRLKATEEMNRFAEYILHILQVDTINMDSTAIGLKLNDYLQPNPNEAITHYLRKNDISIQPNNTDAIAEFFFKKFSENCLESDNFYWIQVKNSRVCNFAFAITNNFEYFFDKDSYLYKKPISILSQPSLTDFRINEFDTAIKLSHMRFTNNAPKANGSIQKRARIIEFFDRSDKDITSKAKYLQLIELLWNNVVKSQKSKSWLSFNKLDNEDLSWVKEQIDQEELFYKVIDINSDKDITEAITAYFDLLFTFKESDCIVKIDKIKKSLTQKKYRKNNAHNKQYNFVMDSDIERKLKVITQKRGIKRNAILETLIENEYRNITSSFEHKNNSNN